ncbi:MAG: mevalonate kinase [Acidilobaceae archaeon]|nr:mevalonate kinase [Acidilobaceae archaeon]MCX8166026.1 mevalonate kinase [Acidilobaceae archaeon]MDW7974668.1 mevalonate kinase [Sulfolobales archaeon]
MIEASAPGKVILFGEHFVVRGTRAIATAVNLRARVRVERAEDKIVIESKNLDLRAVLERSLSSDVRAELAPYVSVLRALQERGYSLVPHRAVIASEMPLSAGLGSSAATSVAYALAYSALHGDPLKEEELFQVSMAGERVAHGNPSGIDNAIAVRGGTIVYRRGEPPKGANARLSNFLLLVVNSGDMRSTKEAVEGVLRLAERYWDVMERVYAAVDRLVERALQFMEEGNGPGLGELMNINHGLLSAVGVSTTKLDLIAHELRRAGALGSKLTGAGRGGCVIALVEKERAEQVARHMTSLGYETYVSEVGAPGARVEYIFK